MYENLKFGPNFDIPLMPAAGVTKQDGKTGKVKLEPNHIKAAETVLSKGDRVEMIPVKDGVKVMRVRREEVKENRPG